MQPTYFPWLGYFDIIDQVEAFIFLDNVQLERRSWQARNRIRSSQGELYLTVPISRTASRDKLFINEAWISEAAGWRKTHLKSIFFAYRKAAYFNEVYPFVEAMINTKTSKLADLNCEVIASIAKVIGIDKRFIRSSEIVNIHGEKAARVALICKSVGCDEYLSPRRAAVYIDKISPGGEFVNNNIALFYHNYSPPVYTQLYGEFLPYLSIVDLLFNCGFDDSLDVIRSGRRQPIDFLSFSKDNNCLIMQGD
jgi:hypothetical protein